MKKLLILLMTVFTITVVKGQEWCYSGTIAGHQYVDLGLPSGIKWATCNVDSSTPAGCGPYFKWGDNQGYEYNERGNSMTGMSSVRYRGESSFFSATWGGSWRLPTIEEIRELMRECKRSFTALNGQTGYRVTGPNGNWIFLPAAGFKMVNGRPAKVGECGYYWTSTTNGSDHTILLYFDSGTFRVDNGINEPYIFYSIRAVSE